MMVSLSLAPAGHLQGHFEAFLPFRRCQTQSLINTRGVEPNILMDSQDREAGISFVLCVCSCLCVCKRERASQKNKRENVHNMYCFSVCVR